MLLSLMHALGAAAFVALTILTVVSRRPAGLGLFAAAVFVMTAAWALSTALYPWLPSGLDHVAESARSWLWLQFLTAVLLTVPGRGAVRAHAYNIAIAALGFASFVNDVRYVFVAASPVDFAASQVLFRIVIAVTGILLIENLYRNTRIERRWHVYPLCIAAGALFAYDLFVFVHALVVRGFDAGVLAVRGIVLVLMVPLLLITMARNENWRVDVHVSRKVVLHTATLTGGGIFLLAATGAASLFGRIPGEWGTILQVGFFCGSAIILATVVSTESARSRARRMIAENFFSRRYDYHEEWMRFVSTVSSRDGGDPLQIRVIRAVSHVVDSPGGVLWLRGSDGAFRVAAEHNMTADREHAEPEDGALVQAFAGGSTVQVFTDGAPDARLAPLRGRGPGSPSPWLAVPLVHMEQLLGFIVVAPPRSPVQLNWESFDLLRAIGMQVASYLSEERATKELSDANAVIAYSKRVTFLGHDVKNIANQLAIMVSNIRAFGDNPEFRADMVRTLEHSVERLNDLMAGLRPEASTTAPLEHIDPSIVIAQVMRELPQREVQVRSSIPQLGSRLTMSEQDFRSVLTHLVTNALEASPRGEVVEVSLKRARGRVLIEIEDHGQGMSPEFIRDKLFTAFASTKARGYGVGAYQARELIRAAGGELEVVSAPGKGTLMRILLPETSSRPRRAEPAAVAS